MTRTALDRYLLEGCGKILSPPTEHLSNPENDSRKNQPFFLAPPPTAPYIY